MSRPVRVRFAPSPTGALHIGGVRTALFNYLFAKKHGGVFYIRIEDTDQTRYVASAEQYIFDALEWLGIAPDETIGKNEKFAPYRQSDRKEIYKEYAEQLVKTGWAYYAFDSSETLDTLRKEAEANKNTFIYNHTVREKLDTSLVLSVEEVEKRIANGDQYVIRFKTPTNETLEIQDIIRGTVRFDTNLLDDKVLFKSDGMPTYHLANIVDDYLMETSHVIRGEEWLPSLPLHYLLYKAFQWEAPEFAHLPLILKPVGNGKLSKRDGDKLGFPVFPLQWETEEGISLGYKENGFFPEAVINFLALLGWNDGTEQEIFSLEELVEKFDLSRIHKAGAKFDPEKNKWFNKQHMKLKGLHELTSSFIPMLENHIDYKILRDEKPLIRKSDLTPHYVQSDYDKCTLTDKNFGYVTRVILQIRDSASFISDFWDLSDYFFVAPTTYDEKAAKNWKEETPALMQQASDVLKSIEDFTSVNIETILKDWMTTNEIGMGKVMQPLRLSLVGALKGPHLFDIIEMIGKQETLNRIEKAIASL